MVFNQIDLFPYFIDQRVVDNYRVVLRELKLLREAKATFIQDLKAIKRMKLRGKRISNDKEFERRRFLKDCEAGENYIKQCEEFKNIDLNISKFEKRRDYVKSEINDSRRCNKKPLRFFTGMKVGQSSEWNFKIHCRPIDEAGHRIYAAENQKYERENHDKGFLFMLSPDRIKILEIKYFGDWQK